MPLYCHFVFQASMHFNKFYWKIYHSMQIAVYLPQHRVWALFIPVVQFRL